MKNYFHLKIIIILLAVFSIYLANKSEDLRKRLNETLQAKTPVYVVKNIAYTQEITVGSEWSWWGDRVTITNIDTLRGKIEFISTDYIREYFNDKRFRHTKNIDDALFYMRRLK